MNPENEFAVGWVGRLDAECDKWKARAKLAEAKVRAVEALCDEAEAESGNKHGTWIATSHVRATLEAAT